MDDGSLSVYVPAYGDRVAVRPFRLESREAPSTSNSKRHSLLERIKQKMSHNDGKEDRNEMEDSHGLIIKRPHAINNTWAKKKTRKIELGWIHEGKQVRKRRGGGTRTITVPRDTRKAELLNYARDLFFPHGQNQLGKFKRATSDIVDFRVEPILDDNITVGNLYDILKRGMLRFYLSTKDQRDGDDDDEEEESPRGNERNWERYCANSGVRFEGVPDKDRRFIDVPEDANDESEDVFSDTLEFKIGSVLGNAEDFQRDAAAKSQPETEGTQTTVRRSEFCQ